MARRNEITGEPRRSPLLRLLAPLALFATVLILIVVISSSLSSDGSDDGPGQRGGGGGGGKTERTAEEKTDRPPKKYEIQSGDSLSTIADRFDVPVAEIVELNPDIDPQALTTGEELKLR